jgi:hypothetical protein
MIAQLDEWDKYLRQTAIDYPPEYFEKCYREYSRVKHDLEEIRNSIEE